MRLTDELTTICQKSATLLPMAQWKYCSLKKTYNENLCIPKRFPILFPNPSWGRINERFMMTPCAHNDIVGLRNRYMKETQHDFKPDRRILNQILDELVHKIRPHWRGPTTLQEFLTSKSGKLRCRYEAAASDILKNGFNPKKHSKINAFIKNEVYDELKPPRMIMGRDPRFNLFYGQYTTALERMLKHIPQCSKGMNFSQRGDQFAELVLGAHILEIDFSKYESTQRYNCLVAIEMGIWERLFEDQEAREGIEKAFKIKMFKDGYTLNGVKFSLFACRGSGDMDTGVFNTLFTVVACRYFEIINGFGNWNFICDGDDNLMRIPVNATYIDTFSQFGFDAKIIRRTDYHDAEYCSGKFIQISPGKFHYVQNLNKLMQALPVFRKLQFSHCKGTYYHSLGYMYKTMYGNIPVFSAIGEFLMSFAVDKHVQMDMLREINPSHAESFKNSKGLIVQADENVFVELAMSFDLPITELMRLDNWYRTNTVKLTPDEDKRYNVTRLPAQTLTSGEVETVQQILYTSITNCQFTLKQEIMLCGL